MAPNKTLTLFLCFSPKVLSTQSCHHYKIDSLVIFIQALTWLEGIPDCQINILTLNAASYSYDGSQLSLLLKTNRNHTPL